MIETFGIPDYDPVEFYATDEVAAAMAATISKLIGQPFDGAWLMWDFQNDEWVNDAPIVVCIGGHQLELCFGDRQELYVSIDEINRTKPLAWFDDSNRPFQWVSNPEREFQALSFRRLSRVGIGESGWSSGGIASFQPSSIELDFSGTHLALVREEPGASLRFAPPSDSQSTRVRWLA